MWPSLAVIILVAGCDRDAQVVAGESVAAPPNRPAASPPVPVPASGPPEISFTTIRHEFGHVHETEKVSTSFRFTNIGGEVLVVRDVKATCGCTTPRLDKREYAPGESGEITVVFDPPGTGPQNKYITVVTNARPATTRLTITADVAPFLVFKPEWLKLGVLAYGVEHRPTIAVWSPDGPIEIVSVSVTAGPARPRVLSAEETSRHPGPRPDDAQFIEVLVPADAPWGGLYFGLEVTARGRPAPDAQTVTHTSSIRVAGQLFGKLKAEPDMFRFGVETGEPFERTTRLERTDGKPFRILGTQVSSPQLPDVTVRVEQVRPDAWDVTMTGVGGRAGLRCFGDVTIRTDVPGEEAIAIGILGVIRAAPPPSR